MSRKSSNPRSAGNPGSIANAIYDAQKKEITSSIAFGFSFIGAGLIAAAIGILKYFNITSKLTDKSESYDAWAWLVIAGVGILVGVIGFISIMKSLVSLGQIGAWAKEAESHASPFQGQKLNRKVAAMNQAQSMNKPGTQGMAEDGGTHKKKGLFKRGKEAKSNNNEDLYYKYNPQERKNTAPPKAAPMMEQKFDYGINEEKKLTFADEFLKKNKRDPFAQYRKDLGIEEEPEKKVEQKPQFIKSASAVNNKNASASSVQKVALQKENNLQPVQKNSEATFSTEKTVLDFSAPKPTHNSKEVGFDLSLTYFAEENAAHGNNTENVNKAEKINEFEKAKPVTEAVKEIEVSAPSETTFEEETTSVPPVSVSEPIVGEKVKEEIKEEIIDEKIPATETESVNNASTSTGIKITYGEHNESDDDMFFSLKTQPLKTSQQPVQLQTQTQNQAQKPRDEVPVKQSTSVATQPSEKLQFKPDTSPSSKQFNPAPTVSLDLDYKKNTKTEYDFSLFEEIDSKHNNTQNKDKNSDEKRDLTESSGFFKKSETTRQENSNFISDFTKGIDEHKNSTDSLSFGLDKSAGTISNQVIQQQNTSDEQYSAFKANDSVLSNPKEHEKKKSFSEKYLNKDQNRKQEEESAIIKNGTRAQRKFIDASEYDEWSCSKCGKVNQEYVGICACGARKPRKKK